MFLSPAAVIMFCLMYLCAYSQSPVPGTLIFHVVDANLGFLARLFLRLITMRDQKMGLWHPLWR